MEIIIPLIHIYKGGDIVSDDDFNSFLDALILKLRNNKKLDDYDLFFLISILKYIRCGYCV